MLSHHDEGDVAVLTLNRPDRRNALNVELCAILGETIQAKTARGARAIVITGEGSSFCSGADLDAVYGEAFLTALYGLFGKILGAPMPVIAAINGPAIGAGAQLALACDLRVGDERARFSIPTARNGLAVDPWTIRRSIELMGASHAQRLLIGAGEISRDEALTCGFVQRAGSLDDALSWAQEISGLAPLSLAYSKRVFNNPHLPSSDESLREAFLACFDSEDVAEGRLAREENRAPQFRGR